MVVVLMFLLVAEFFLDEHFDDFAAWVSYQNFPFCVSGLPFGNKVLK